VNELGTGLTVTTVGSLSSSITLFPEPAGKRGPDAVLSPQGGFPITPTNPIIFGQGLPPGVVAGDPVNSSVLEGSRLYASTPERLRAADIRSGATLFDLPWPKDAMEWVKAENSRTSTMTTMPPPLPGMGNPMMAPQYRRVYVPQGVFLQEQRMGGGILCGPLSAVVEDLWIAPLHDRAVICLRGQFLKQKPVATTVPVNVLPASSR
jgi:hypothetical protein